MKGEFSRLTFDHRRHFAATLSQQGRVGSDADWNEWVEQVLYRFRKETIDVIGACGRPEKHPGFTVSVNGSGTPSPSVQLSAGRLYAGGMLAELEKAIDFMAQYDWPIPSSATWAALFPGVTYPGLDFKTLTQTGSQVDLFYVEVWLRHVTALIDEAERQESITDAAPNPPDWNATPEVGSYIRERALGGPDTCTRLQTVAQVKRWPVTDPTITTCEAACTVLSNSVHFKTLGALQVNVPPTAPVTKPCDEPQIGGYGGAENRFYRVEVHDPGPAGTGTFKWSFENGAFLVPVINFNALTVIPAGTSINVRTIGNDQITKLKLNDWVEMCGEETELGMWRNPLAQLAADPIGLPDGTWQVQLKGPASVIVPHAPFLRRWSGNAQTITLNTPFKLDAGSGLSVTFFANTSGGINPANTYFRELDYWIWAARTLSRDIEPPDLANTPQAIRGIIRHKCCLALISWATDGKGNISDTSIDPCPNEFPPLTNIASCCTVVVNVGDDIQEAIDSLPSQGGCVCLKPGVHTITQPIVIQGKSNIVLHGETISAVVQNSVGGNALIISDGSPGPTTDIIVEGITFLVAPQPGQQDGIVIINNPIRCAVRNCKVGSTTPGQPPFAPLGFSVTRTINSPYQPAPTQGDIDIEIRGNTVGDVITGVFAAGVFGINIVENLVAARTIQDPAGNFVSAGMIGIDIVLPGGTLSVSDNRISDFSQAVVVQTRPPTPSPAIYPESPPVEVLIERNVVARNALASGSAINYGWTAPLGVLLQLKAYGIFADATNARIAENTIGLADPGHGGILVSGSGANVCDNSVPSSIATKLAPPSAAPTVAVGASGTAGTPTGTYIIAVTFVSAAGESQLGPPSEPILVSTQSINVSNLPIADPKANVTARNIYGSKVGVSAAFQLIGTIPDNATTFTVTIDQPSWARTAPSYDWPSLPISIVAYNPNIELMNRCQIEGNVLTGPQRGIAVLTELQKLTAFDSPTVEGNRIANGVIPETIDLNGPQQTLVNLENSLRFLGSAFGILIVNATGATIARNAISLCTAGIVALHNDSATCDDNNVQQCTIGILLSTAKNSTANNGTMINNQLAIGLHNVQSTVVRGNRCEFTQLRARIVPGVVNCLVLNSALIRFIENTIWGAPHTGFLAFESRSVWFERNLVEGSGGTGIVAVKCQDQICFDRNDLNGCGLNGKSAIEANFVAGFQINGWQVGTAVSSAIVAVDCAGVITIDGCNIRETLQASGARCADICVLGGAHSRIRDCRVVRTLDLAPVSRALLLQPAADHEDTLFTHADVGGNYIDVTSSAKGTDFMAIEIDPAPVQFLPDVVFVGNTVRKRGFANQNFAVALGADKSQPCASLVVTSNRIIADTLGGEFPLPALVISYAGGLSYVGNVLSAPAKINPTAGVNEQPTPPGNFNVTAP